MIMAKVWWVMLKGIWHFLCPGRLLHVPGLVQSTILYSVPTATRVIRAAHQLITNMITRQTAEPSNATHCE